MEENKEEKKVENKENKKVLKTKHFLIAQKENNLFENKDNVELILGRYEIIGTLINDEIIKKQKQYKVYKVKVNDSVNIAFYYSLLLQRDFSNTDFKKISFADLKKLIKKDYIVSSIFSDKNMELKKYIMEKE